MKEKILYIISDIIDIEIENLTFESERTYIEEWDSLAHIQIIASVEDEFNICIPIENIHLINKVSDFFGFID